jgi:hypothetical protein
MMLLKAMSVKCEDISIVGVAVVRDDDDGGVCALCREVRMVQLLG